MKRLAEEFGPDWAMQHIVPQVCQLSHYLSPRLHFSFLSKNVTWYEQSVSMEKYEANPLDFLVVETASGKNKKSTLASIYRLGLLSPHPQPELSQVSWPTVLTLADRFWTWLTTHTICIGWPFYMQFLYSLL